MPIEKQQFLKQFSQHALDERISLFLGAGGSCDAGYPTWADLFSPLAKELETPIDAATDYYRLAQYYSNYFGPAELRKRINEKINRNKYQSPLLKELTQIGFTNVWTTNFDNSIESNYHEKGILTNKIFRDSDFSNVDINKRINIFKMNGDISNLDGIVATQDDYENYNDTHRIMMMFFKRELISSTFLFIGYSFTDHLVLDCTSEIIRYLGDSASYHYAIMKKDSDNVYFNYFIDDIERRYHIRVLLVDEYNDIPEVLMELNDRIRKKKIFISGAFRSFEENITKFSHDLSKNMSTYLLENDYRIVNGIGRRFGTHLIGYANEYLAKQGIKNIEKHMIVTPFVGNDDKAEIDKKNKREKVISQCGSALFVFGEMHNGSENKISGVWQEFQIAVEHHKIIIPILYPNYMSEKIWEEVKNNITSYPYLEKYIDILTYNQPTDVISKCVVQILDSIQ